MAHRWFGWFSFATLFCCLFIWRSSIPTSSFSSVSTSHHRIRRNLGKPLDPITHLLQTIGGPICREEIHTTACPPLPCLDYHQWYQSIYKQTFNNLKKKSKKNNNKRKIILSVGHNGFGNQLFQHYFALQVALYTNSILYLTKIDLQHSPTSSALPPNTHDGAEWIDLISDPLMFWSSLPDSHPDKVACQRSNLTYSKRPYDIRSRNSTQKIKFNLDLLQFLDPNGEIECLITIGYFQNKDLCLDTIYKMWPSLVNQPNRTFVPNMQFEPNDLVIHMRCQPGHYGVPSESLSPLPPLLISPLI
jgi:hypothetical protein